MTRIQQIQIPKGLFARETVAVPQLTEFQGRAASAIWSALQAQGRTSPEHAYVRCRSESDIEMDVEVGLPVDDEIVGDNQSLGGAYAALAKGDRADLIPAGAPWGVYEWFNFESAPEPAAWPPQEDWRTVLVQPLGSVH